MSVQPQNRGYHVERRKAHRYMNETDIYPIHPRVSLSKRVQQAKVCPYLLRNATTDALNQARSIDITYIPIRHGFLYLAAVIDWYSRCTVSWEVDDTLDTRMVINALKKTFAISKPQILNSGQGRHKQLIGFLLSFGIQVNIIGPAYLKDIVVERAKKVYEKYKS